MIDLVHDYKIPYAQESVLDSQDRHRFFKKITLYFQL